MKNPDFLFIFFKCNLFIFFFYCLKTNSKQHFFRCSIIFMTPCMNLFDLRFVLQKTDHRLCRNTGISVSPMLSHNAVADFNSQTLRLYYRQPASSFSLDTIAAITFLNSSSSFPVGSGSPQSSSKGLPINGQPTSHPMEMAISGSGISSINLL